MAFLLSLPISFSEARFASSLACFSSLCQIASPGPSPPPGWKKSTWRRQSGWCFLTALHGVGLRAYWLLSMENKAQPRLPSNPKPCLKEPPAQRMDPPAAANHWVWLQLGGSKMFPQPSSSGLPWDRRQEDRRTRCSELVWACPGLCLKLECAQPPLLLNPLPATLSHHLILI